MGSWHRPKKPTPLPVPRDVSFAVVVKDFDTGAPIPNAPIDILGDQYTAPEDGRTDADGFCDFRLTAGVVGGPAVLVTVEIHADGYASVMQDVSVATDTRLTFELKADRPIVPTFTPAQLRDMQGDIMIWCPDLKPDFSMLVRDDPDPNKQIWADPETGIRNKGDVGATPHGIHAGWVWWLYLPFYPKAKREIFYQEVRRLGHTHGVVQVAQPTVGGGYHGLRPMSQADVDGWGETVSRIHQEIIEHGFIPICAGVAPVGSPGGAPLAPGFDGTKALIAMSDWDNNSHAAGRIKALAEAFPNALLYYERPQNATKAEPDADYDDPIYPTPTNGGAWLRAIQQQYPNFVGVLYEVNHPDGIDLCVKELTLANGWWRDVQQVLFETDTYWKFWDNLDARSGRDFNDVLLKLCPWLQGCMSGATPHPVIMDTSGEVVIEGRDDMIDMGAARIVEGPDFRGWPVTTRITRIQLSTNGVHLDFDKKEGPNRWPDSITPGWDGSLQYSLGMALKINGTWYVNAPIEFWHGLYEDGGAIQKPGQISNNWFYDQRWGAMAHYQPAPGEQIGLFVVAGDARNNANPLHERSNVVLIPLPSDGQVVSFTFT